MPADVPKARLAAFSVRAALVRAVGAARSARYRGGSRMRASDLTEDQWRMVREEVAKAHEHCPCVEKLTARVIELEQAQEEHIQTHRREAMLGLPTYDRRSD